MIDIKALFKRASPPDIGGPVSISGALLEVINHLSPGQAILLTRERWNDRCDHGCR